MKKKSKISLAKAITLGLLLSTGLGYSTGVYATDYPTIDNVIVVPGIEGGTHLYTYEYNNWGTKYTEADLISWGTHIFGTKTGDPREKFFGIALTVQVGDLTLTGIDTINGNIRLDSQDDGSVFTLKDCVVTPTSNANNSYSGIRGAAAKIDETTAYGPSEEKDNTGLILNHVTLNDGNGVDNNVKLDDEAGSYISISGIHDIYGIAGSDADGTYGVMLTDGTNITMDANDSAAIATIDYGVLVDGSTVTSSSAIYGGNQTGYAISVVGGSWDHANSKGIADETGKFGSVKVQKGGTVKFEADTGYNGAAIHGVFGDVIVTGTDSKVISNDKGIMGVGGAYYAGEYESFTALVDRNGHYGGVIVSAGAKVEATNIAIGDVGGDVLVDGANSVVSSTGKSVWTISNVGVGEDADGKHGGVTVSNGGKVQDLYNTAYTESETVGGAINGVKGDVLVTGTGSEVSSKQGYGIVDVDGNVTVEKGAKVEAYKNAIKDVAGDVTVDGATVTSDEGTGIKTVGNDVTLSNGAKVSGKWGAIYKVTGDVTATGSADKKVEIGSATDAFAIAEVGKNVTTDYATVTATDNGINDVKGNVAVSNTDITVSSTTGYGIVEVGGTVSFVGGKLDAGVGISTVAGNVTVGNADSTAPATTLTTDDNAVEYVGYKYTGAYKNYIDGDGPHDGFTGDVREKVTPSANLIVQNAAITASANGIYAVNGNVTVDGKNLGLDSAKYDEAKTKVVSTGGKGITDVVGNVNVVQGVLVSAKEDAISRVGKNVVVGHSKVVSSDGYAINGVGGSVNVRNEAELSSEKSGIVSVEGDVTVTNSTVTSSEGTGIKDIAKSVTLGNGAVVSGKWGGIFDVDGSVTATDSTITSVPGTTGTPEVPIPMAAIDKIVGNVTLNNTVVTGNWGGIFDVLGNVNVTGGSVTTASAGDDNFTGAIEAVKGAVTVTGTAEDKVEISGKSGIQYVGYTYDATEGNYSKSGEKSGVTLSNVTVTANNGDGIYGVTGDVDMKASTITANTADGKNGRGIAKVDGNVTVGGTEDGTESTIDAQRIAIWTVGGDVTVNKNSQVTSRETHAISDVTGSVTIGEGVKISAGSVYNDEPMLDSANRGKAITLVGGNVTVTGTEDNKVDLQSRDSVIDVVGGSVNVQNADLTITTKANQGKKGVDGDAVIAFISNVGYTNKAGTTISTATDASVTLQDVAFAVTNSAVVFADGTQVQVDGIRNVRDAVTLTNVTGIDVNGYGIKYVGGDVTDTDSDIKATKSAISHVGYVWDATTSAYVDVTDEGGAVIPANVTIAADKKDKVTITSTEGTGIKAVTGDVSLTKVDVSGKWGGIYDVDGKVTATDSKITSVPGTTGTPEVPIPMAAIDKVAKDVTLTNTEVNGAWGGIFDVGGNVKVTGGSVTTESAGEENYNGAIQAVKGDVEAKDTTLTGGSGIAFVGYTWNEADDNYSVAGPSNVTLENTTVTANDGDGIYGVTGDVDMKASTITANTADGKNGRGIAKVDGNVTVGGTEDGTESTITSQRIAIWTVGGDVTVNKNSQVTSGETHAISDVTGSVTIGEGVKISAGSVYKDEPMLDSANRGKAITLVGGDVTVTGTATDKVDLQSRDSVIDVVGGSVNVQNADLTITTKANQGKKVIGSEPVEAAIAFISNVGYTDKAGTAASTATDVSVALKNVILNVANPNEVYADGTKVKVDGIRHVRGDVSVKDTLIFAGRNGITDVKGSVNIDGYNTIKYGGNDVCASVVAIEGDAVKSVGDKLIATNAILMSTNGNGINNVQGIVALHNVGIGADQDGITLTGAKDPVSAPAGVSAAEWAFTNHDWALNTNITANKGSGISLDGRGSNHQFNLNNVNIDAGDTGIKAHNSSVVYLTKEARPETLGQPGVGYDYVMEPETGKEGQLAITLHENDTKDNVVVGIDANNGSIVELSHGGDVSIQLHKTGETYDTVKEMTVVKADGALHVEYDYTDELGTLHHYSEDRPAEVRFQNLALGDVVATDKAYGFVATKGAKIGGTNVTDDTFTYATLKADNQGVGQDLVVEAGNIAKALYADGNNSQIMMDMQGGKIKVESNNVTIPVDYASDSHLLAEGTIVTIPEDTPDKEAGNWVVENSNLKFVNTAGIFAYDGAVVAVKDVDISADAKGYGNAAGVDAHSATVIMTNVDSINVHAAKDYAYGILADGASIVDGGIDGDAVVPAGVRSISAVSKGKRAAGIAAEGTNNAVTLKDVESIFAQANGEALGVYAGENAKVEIAMNGGYEHVNSEGADPVTMPGGVVMAINNDAGEAVGVDAMSGATITLDNVELIGSYAGKGSAYGISNEGATVNVKFNGSQLNAVVGDEATGEAAAVYTKNGVTNIGDLDDEGVSISALNYGTGDAYAIQAEGSDTAANKVDIDNIEVINVEAKNGNAALVYVKDATGTNGNTISLTGAEGDAPVPVVITSPEGKFNNVLAVEGNSNVSMNLNNIAVQGQKKVGDEVEEVGTDIYVGTGATANVDLQKSSFKGAVVGAGTTNMNLSEGSYWGVTDNSKVNELTNNGTIDMMADKDVEGNPGFSTLTVAKMNDGKGVYKMDVNMDPEAEGGNTDKVIIGGTESTGEKISMDINPNVVNMDENGNVIEKLTDENAPVLFVLGDGVDSDKFDVSINGNKYFDFGATRTEAAITKDGNQGKLALTPTKENGKQVLSAKGNAAMSAVIDPETWHMDNEALYENISNLRPERERSDVWASYTNKKNTYDDSFDDKVFNNGDIDKRYSGVVLGIDNKAKYYQKANANLFVGVMFSYGDGKYNWADGSNELDGAGVGLYAIYKTAKGAYFGATAKYNRYSFDEIKGTQMGSGKSFNGEYDTDALGLSLVAGRRYAKDQQKGFYVEPQAELAYVNYGSDKYDLDGMDVEVNSMKSLRARLGFQIGSRNISKKTFSDIYAKVSFLHEFFGDNDVDMGAYTYESDQGGSWVNFALGFSVGSMDKFNANFSANLSRGSHKSKVGFKTVLNFLY